MDIFCEYLVKRKKSSSEKIMISVIIILGILFTLGSLLFLFPILSTLISSLGAVVFPLVVVIWYLVISYIKMYSVEYEYSITDGEMDVDKIVNKSKRVRVLTMRLRNFEVIAPILSDKYTNEFKALKTADCSANAKASATYFAVYSDDEGRKCLLFDPSDKMIEITQKYCPDKFFRA